jgi:hypothetical protein
VELIRQNTSAQHGTDPTINRSNSRLIYVHRQLSGKEGYPRLCYLLFPYNREQLCLEVAILLVSQVMAGDPGESCILATLRTPQWH